MVRTQVLCFVVIPGLLSACAGGAGGPSTPPAVCGDGALGAHEACDDGNLQDGDGCDSNCTASA